MRSSIIASAWAARDLGYPTLADTILESELTPGAISRLFAMSASPDAGHVAAVVILAAATALADREAVKLVRDHWQEIAAIPESGWPLAGYARPKPKF